MARTRVKICCIATIEEARTAITCGADAIGLVGKMPSGTGVIDDAKIAEIASAIPPPIATFLLTSDEAVQKVLSVMLNEVKHPFFRTNKWILQSLRSFRMTFSLFWDNLQSLETRDDERDPAGRLRG